MESNLKGELPETGKMLRKTAQYLMPSRITEQADLKEGYNIYPSFSLGINKIFTGYGSLTDWIIEQKTVVIEGYAGIFWDQVQEEISNRLAGKGITVSWIKTSDYLKPATVIGELVAPFLGTEESVWGTKCTLTLGDLYETEKLSSAVPDHNTELNIIIGPAAALGGWKAPLVYIDLPKNELQFRMRAGSINNLGAAVLTDHFKMYKRFYFVDWVLLNNHKKVLLNDITVMADGQWPQQINWMYQKDLMEGLEKMSHSVIRVRPWFEPGAWGGQWIKERISKLNKDVVNYAWSFELIVPENGLVFESNGNLLEVSFDTLMFANQQQVLGKHAAVYGDEFPVRFDFLDTFDGGNLSIQCHPRLKYIQENFGENITQDETYYILDCEKQATVYLGFQEDIDPTAFKTALENSEAKAEEIDITQYVQVHEAKKHDLFLIPNGTVHSAGKGNLVLEISATPYIFTFKMYDWLRLDLDGKPRPINIDHAFNNLDFNRKGPQVEKELISHPAVIEETESWQIVHLPTHQEHFYDVHRLEFDKAISRNTENGCHIMMLVEGESISIETEDGTVHNYAYAETFVVPAAAGSYTLTNQGTGRAKVILAFLK
ncbi:MAG: class I mannose-6-phosphate isomerase [Pedobacter sp.]|uniref:class I mannose-6-phosphate isomerase n=1 Tax=Pedobacter sp. TaxID=1411316 RepID=UPI003392447C